MGHSDSGDIGSGKTKDKAEQQLQSSVFRDIQNIEKETSGSTNPGLKGAYDAFKNTDGNWSKVEDLVKNGTPEEIMAHLKGNDQMIQLVSKQIQDITKRVDQYNVVSSGHVNDLHIIQEPPGGK